MKSDKYYSILALEKNKNIYIKSKELFVDFDSPGRIEFIQNDIEFLAKKKENIYFWISGGGSYIVNNQYLMVVERGASSGVNPGQLSLFTGRSDSKEELENPFLLTRELFEEVILTVDGDTVKPENREQQEIIDSVFKLFYKNKIVNEANLSRIAIEPFNLKTSKIKIKKNGNIKEFKCLYFINRNNDINVFFLFGININLNTFSAYDGEFHFSDDTRIFQNRILYLYDFDRDEIINLNIEKRRDVVRLENFTISENLNFIINILKNGNL